MAARTNVAEISRLKDKDIFLDTNIWVFLFCPWSSDPAFIIKKYSRAFRFLLQSDNRIYTDITVLSEFINRYLRHAFQVYKVNNHKGDTFHFKRDYWQTRDFKETLQLVVSTVKGKILERASIANTGYSKNDIEGLLLDFKERAVDFNDLHIERLCKENKLILLTDDGDYADSDIEIISGNPRFFDQG